MPPQSHESAVLSPPGVADIFLQTSLAKNRLHRQTPGGGGVDGVKTRNLTHLAVLPKYI